jgi:hypothetical protein
VGLAAFDVEQRRLLWSQPADGQCNALAVAEQIGALLCGSENGHVYAYDLQTGIRTQRDLDYQFGPVRAVSVTPDGSRMVVGGGSVLGVCRASTRSRRRTTRRVTCSCSGADR